MDTDNLVHVCIQCTCMLCRQLRARRALLQLKDVPLRTRRGLLLYKVNGNITLLVLNGTSLICNSARLALRSADDVKCMKTCIFFLLLTKYTSVD